MNAARAAENAGQWREAERLWEAVRGEDPSNTQALFSLVVHATQRGDLDTAHARAESACAAAPNDPFAWLMLARVRKDQGNGAGELGAIDAALDLDAYFVPAILAKASWMDRNGSPSKAAMFYRVALKISPPEAHWPQALRSQLDHAQSRARIYGDALAARLSEMLEEELTRLPPAQAERWREAISIRSGRSSPYTSQSNQFTVPRLPAIPFFERDLFPWAAALEAKTEIIAAEFSALQSESLSGFRPYISYGPGEPMNQFAELNNSPKWSAFQLYRYGERVEENCARVPQTMAALAELELARLPGCPNVMFSVLAPRTQIPPHQGETNARVVAHLPLIVPDGCLYRVGFEQRRWRVGELLVFDDTIEHEARNDSDLARIVLIFDVWNPLLSESERRIARAMLEAAGSFDANGG